MPQHPVFLDYISYWLVLDNQLPQILLNRDKNNCPQIALGSKCQNSCKDWAYMHQLKQRTEHINSMGYDTVTVRDRD